MNGSDTAGNDNAKAIERANSYRQMMDMWPWKDFQKIMDDIRGAALEKAIIAGTMEEVQIQRGIVKCIDTLNGEIGYVLNGASK